MTFDKMSVWPIGYFRAVASWLLNNSRDIPKRLAVINAEIQRIGEINVIYRTVESGGNVKATEERIGISVTHGSSVGRLVQAYIAQGGNPLDISPFTYPSGTEILVINPEDGSTTIRERYPHGGVVAPVSANYNEPMTTSVDPNNPTQEDSGDTGWGNWRGGYLRTDRYYAPRQGGRIHRAGTDFDTVTKTMHQIRSWANQDIKERLQDMEWRIIKLCDLREQLEKERNEILVQAFGGGAVDSVGPLDPNRFNQGLQVQVLIQTMNQILFETQNDGSVLSYGQPNATLNYLGFTFEDAPSEGARDAMGS